MGTNEHLVPLLTAFEQVAEPGYALLVDAPWGSGKTFLVNKWLSGKQFVYVSLYGLASAAAIEEALFQAALKRDSGKDTGKLAQTTSRAISGATKVLGKALENTTGFSIDLSGIYRTAVLSQLPSLLVFDDIERANMQPSEVLGLLNRFVEHEKINVILIANQAELEKDPAYTQTREKVVGRVVAIKADTENALPQFLHLLPESGPREFLNEQKQLILRVFETTGCQNLRLLNQILREFSDFYLRIPPAKVKLTHAMESLLATYAVLSIAFHGGELSRADMQAIKGDVSTDLDFFFPDRFKDVDLEKMSLEERTELERKKKLSTFRRRWKDTPNIALSRPEVMTPKLVWQQIVEGYASEEVVEQELAAVSFFSNSESSENAWKTLWWWRSRPTIVVEEAIGVLRKQLELREIIVPWVLLHVTGVLLDLAENRLIDEDRAAVQEMMLSYLKKIEVIGKLPSTQPKRKWSRDHFSESADGLGYNGRDSKEFQTVLDELIDALDRRFWAESAKREEEVLELCSTSPSNFSAAIGYGLQIDGAPDYSNDPIFASFDPARFADTVFRLPPFEWRTVLSPFKDRIAHLRVNQPNSEETQRDEAAWLIRVKHEAEKIATGCACNVRAAQIRSAIIWYFGFLEQQLPADS